MGTYEEDRERWGTANEWIGHAAESGGELSGGAWGGPLGLVGSGLEFSHGVHDLAHGNIVEGGAEIGQGMSGAVEQGAELFGMGELAEGAGRVGNVFDVIDIAAKLANGDAEGALIDGSGMAI